MIDDKYLKSKEFFDSFSAVIKLSILFLVGVGNYRSVLFLIIFFCTKAFIDYKDKHDSLKVIFLPFLLGTLYLDCKFGQLWLPHNNNLILFAILFVVIDHVSTMHINALFEKTSNNYIFSYCNNCRFENIKLISKCNNCGYVKAGLEINKRIDVDCVFHEQYHLQSPLLRKKMNQNSIDNLTTVR